jgi:hypothetical protein
VYRCQSCAREVPVYNSCIDRHCPQCSGGRRARWLEKTAGLLLPELHYFQVVFTLPSELRSLALGNRRELFSLLMQSSWLALRDRLREEQGIEPAAQLVLHTWNQELDVHPHVHALVPGGGPSLDGQRWINTSHPRQVRRKKPYLCDAEELSRRFQRHMVEGLRRLRSQGRLKFPSTVLEDPARFEAWLEALSQSPWAVYVQGPPRAKSSPEQILKYLARYMTGGPLSDARLISHVDDEVLFWARSRDKRNRSRPFRLSGVRFTYRWSQHILPKGFTKSRCYGGYHNRNRTGYMSRCHELRKSLVVTAPDKALSLAAPVVNPAEPLEPTWNCPNCDRPMQRDLAGPRPRWQEVLHGPRRPEWYGMFLNGHGRAFQGYRGDD